MKIKVINNRVFTDVPNFNPAEQEESSSQGNLLSNTRKLTVGEGESSIKLGKQGLWSGSKLFNLAPFRMDINGNMTWNDGTNDRMTIKRV